MTAEELRQLFLDTEKKFNSLYGKALFSLETKKFLVEARKRAKIIKKIQDDLRDIAIGWKVKVVVPKYTDLYMEEATITDIVLYAPKGYSLEYGQLMDIRASLKEDVFPRMLRHCYPIRDANVSKRK